MTTKPKIETCPTCKWDNGWHYDDPDRPTRPHRDAARLLEQAHHLVELAHEEQTKRAREIVANAAESLFEFSANNIRDEIDAAQIDGPVVGAAFAWAVKEGLIESTGRRVQSNEASTRHAIHVWRSVKRAAELGVA